MSSSVSENPVRKAKGRQFSKPPDMLEGEVRNSEPVWDWWFEWISPSLCSQCYTPVVIEVRSDPNFQPPECSMKCQCKSEPCGLRKTVVAQRNPKKNVV